MGVTGSDLSMLLIAQFGLYGLGWGLIAAFLREVRGPALLWATFSVCNGMAIALAATLPGTGPLPNLATLLVGLAGYLCAGVAVDLFLHGRLAFRHTWLALLVAGMGAQVGLSLADTAPVIRAVAFNGAVGTILIVPVLMFHKALRREFGRLGLAAQVPGALFGSFVLLRAVRLLLDPGLLVTQPTAFMSSLSVVLPTLVASGIFNLTFAGLVISRGVMRLRHLARHDALTGLLNRPSLEELLRAEWHRFQRQRSGFAVAFIDIDHFKNINDTHGHDAGDRVLVALADTLRRHARAADSVARWGGEEFVVLMPDTTASGALRAAQRLRNAAAGIARSSKLPPLTLSVGLAAARAEDHDADGLVARADAAMYDAKRTGRDRVVLAP